jgi:methanogenic corrinoid protein MtbC1
VPSCAAARRLERLMPNVLQTEAPEARLLPGQSLDHLAATALTFVAHRQRDTGRGIIAERAAQLQQAVTEGSTAEAFAVVRQMARAGIAPADIADLYVPAVARQLGDLWCSDEISFATVTIGVARLQGLLREIEALAVLPRRAGHAGFSLLVLVAEGVDHTLGAMVLTGQMRRAGHAVRLILGAQAEAVTTAVSATRFDAVLISAPRGTSAGRLKPLVNAIRTASAKPPPVVIGGTVLDAARDDGADILVLTGADHATCDPNEALRLCGLVAMTRDGVDRRQGS